MSLRFCQHSVQHIFFCQFGKDAKNVVAGKNKHQKIIFPPSLFLLSLPGRYAGVRGLELDNLDPPPAGGRGPPHHEAGGAGPQVLVVDNVLPSQEAAQSWHYRGS